MTKMTWAQVLTRYSQLRRRQRYGMLAAPAVLVALAVAGLVLLDQQSQASAIEQAIAQVAQQRAEKQAYLTSAKAYTERLHALEDQLRAAHAVLPDNPEVPQFLAQLGTMAHDTGLVIERFEPQPELARDFFAELTFHVQVRGSFHQLAMFLAQVGNMERIVSVGNIGMGAGKGEQNQMIVDGAFDVKIFRLLSEEQIAQHKSDKSAEEAH